MPIPPLHTAFMMIGRHSYSFTIRDLAWLILVAAILLSLGVPLIVARRESARRAQCQNNLRQLAAACLNWESLYGAYPPAMVNFSGTEYWISTGKENGLTQAGPNWASNLAEQMGFRTLALGVYKCLEQPDDVLWNAADDCPEVGARVGSFRPMGTPAFMICPTAVPAKLPHASPHTELENLAKGNYAACMGSGIYLEGIDGSAEVDAMLAQTGLLNSSDPPGSRNGSRGLVTVRVKQVPSKEILSENVLKGRWRIGRGSGIAARRIHDGTSKTMMLSEVLTVDGKGRIAGGSDDIRGVWVTASMGGSTYSHKTTPNSTVKDRINGCEVDANDLPNTSRLSCIEQPATGPTAGDTFAAARSEHRGGVLAASADGAVHFYGNDIDPDVWSALGTRANGD